jgi:hypothetical protein
VGKELTTQGTHVVVIKPLMDDCIHSRHDVIMMVRALLLDSFFIFYFIYLFPVIWSTVHSAAVSLDSRRPQIVKQVATDRIREMTNARYTAQSADSPDGGKYGEKKKVQLN